MAGLVSTIQNTTCTIGDKTFQFSGAAYISGTTPIAAEDVQFTPLPGDPTSPGFALSGSAFFIKSPGNALECPYAVDGSLCESFDWPYTVSISDPSTGAAIVGSTALMSDAGAGGSPGFFNVQATASNSLYSFTTPGCNVFAITHFDYFSSDNNIFATSSLPCPDTKIGGDVDILLSAVNGDISFRSETIRINEAQVSTPEPGSLALLGTGLVVGAWWRKRRR
jgi:hypothetical protein